MIDEDLRALERAAQLDPSERERLWAARCRLDPSLAPALVEFDRRVARLLGRVNFGVLPCSAYVALRDVADVLIASDRRPAVMFKNVERKVSFDRSTVVEARAIVVACRAAGRFMGQVTLGIARTNDLRCSQTKAIANAWPSLAGSLGPAPTEKERELREAIAVAWATNARVKPWSRFARAHVDVAAEWARRVLEGLPIHA